MYNFTAGGKQWVQRGETMKVKELMTQPVIPIGPGESVAVAARTLTHYNIGALPVCSSSGVLCGVVTDRDLVTRCMAADPDLSACRIICLPWYTPATHLSYNVSIIWQPLPLILPDQYEQPAESLHPLLSPYPSFSNNSFRKFQKSY